mmetsp:Transcript_10263/g.28283  ORF Transcript_10263/g.28283 Transcript_10263/m.28283 type:complete len:827 (-) Transcript_10263:189-2669(-)
MLRSSNLRIARLFIRGLLTLNENLQKTKKMQKPPPVPGRVAQSQKQQNKRLNVFLRMRPCSKPEDSVMEVLEPGNAEKQPHPTKIRTLLEAVAKNHAREYEFSQVFGPGVSQTKVYERTAAPLIGRLCSGNRVGESALLFSYGITGGGKTHTVLGDVRDQNNAEWGIVPRCLSQVLQKVSNTDLKVYLSFFEIYNENVFDLLPATKQKKSLYQVNLKPLKIREQRGQTVIKGLSKHQIQSLEHALSLVRKANESRHTATNHLNRHSSRSHCICQITVKHTSEPEAPPNDDSSVDTSTLIDEESATLWIVDLAGSERSKRTNVGSVRLKEASHINKSLMTLMGCLTRGERNFRDSKLTVLFMHHWMKHGKTSMIVNVHPSQDDYDETQHVLAYAISTKTIPNLERKESASTSTATTQVVEYDYHGRRKNATNESNAKTTAKRVLPSTKGVGAKPATKKASRAARVKAVDRKVPKQAPLRTASNQGRKRKEAPQSKVEAPAMNTKNDTEPISDTVNKKQKLEDSDIHKGLRLAQAEIEKLKAQNKKLSRQIETTETAVRAEVAEEMLAEMGAIRERYEDTISELKSKVAISKAVSEKKEKLDRAERKISELLEKIEECEDEMVRMSETHAVSQKAAQNKIRELQTELAEYKSQCSKLESSKVELIRNYEQLLGDGADSEHSAVEDEDQESRPIFCVERVRCATEPRPRRRLAINGDKALKPMETATPAKIQSVERSAFSQPKLRLGSESNQGEAKLSAIKAPRQPLGFLPVNAKHHNIENSNESSELLFPKKKAKRDPETGTYVRPRGRAPTGTVNWDEVKGAWTTAA